MKGDRKNKRRGVEAVEGVGDRSSKSSSDLPGEYLEKQKVGKDKKRKNDQARESEKNMPGESSRK